MVAKNTVVCNVLAVALFLSQVFIASARSPQKQPLFIGMHWVSAQIGWVSGKQSTCMLTKNGGKTWQRFSFLENDSLQFRDVHGFDQDSCLLMAAGTGNLSRIYSFSVHKGFKLRYQMEQAAGFLVLLP
jgi:hypothetical protein